MKNKAIFNGLLTIMVILAPVLALSQAAITVDITSPSGSEFAIGQAVNFSAAVTGGEAPYSITWNFGDGTSAFGENYAKTYTAAGTYSVTVTASDFNEVTANDSITFIVETGDTPDLPTVDLKANNQGGALTVQGSATASTTITLSWSTTNATACVASGDWSGAKSIGASEEVIFSPSTTSVSKNYILTCTGPDGSASDSVAVTVQAPGTPDSLIITNVRVTDITKTSAIIRWTTNRPADSRVIYDTVSHPSISGASAPNYGYAFSTGTDSSLVTEHAVTISGLSSGTKYFFRVISED